MRIARLTALSLVVTMMLLAAAVALAMTPASGGWKGHTA
jgi:hypothetical protein